MRMRVLHTYNLHRGGGGSDDAALGSIRALRDGGVDIVEFARDSRSIPLTFQGKVKAFCDGVYARRAVREFERELERSAPDLVHAHELYPLISPWVLPRCAGAGVPVVMSAYDFRMTCPIATHHAHGELCHRCVGGAEHWCVLRNCRASFPESIAYALRNAVARRFELWERYVDHYIVLSDFSRSWMIEKAGVAPERVTTIAPAIRLPAEPVADPSVGAYVGFAGRFVPEKGVEVMVKACRSLGLPMAFAGNAPAHPAVDKDDAARFVMTRTREELAAFYRGARVLVVPSLYYETFNIVAAEAMSHGVPVIASRIGALPSTVRDGETGLLFEPGDPDDLASHLIRVWEEPDLCRRLGANARRRVGNDFTEQRHFTALTRVYTAVAEGGGQG